MSRIMVERSFDPPFTQTDLDAVSTEDRWLSGNVWRSLDPQPFLRRPATHGVRI